MAEFLSLVDLHTSTGGSGPCVAPIGEKGRKLDVIGYNMYLTTGFLASYSQFQGFQGAGGQFWWQQIAPLLDKLSIDNRHLTCLCHEEAQRFRTQQNTAITSLLFLVVEKD